MVRELVMAGICALGVIALAWAMDHPRKELGSALVLGAFAVLVLVAFLKNQNRVSRAPQRLLKRSVRREPVRQEGEMEHHKGASGHLRDASGHGESDASERKCGGDSRPASAG